MNEKNEHEFLKDLLQNETLKEPLREALMTLAFRIERTYSFMKEIRNQMNTDIQNIHEEISKIHQEISLISSAQTKIKLPKIKLRSEPKTISTNQVKMMFKEKGFFATDWNPSGRFDNDLVDNNDGTITDRATDLMWQKDGSDNRMLLKDTGAYLQALNKIRFVGHSDWRLPTVEEGGSLLENTKRNGDLYIDPLFNQSKRWIWTSDRYPKIFGAGWHVGFYNGVVDWYDTAADGVVRACRTVG